MGQIIQGVFFGALFVAGGILWSDFSDRGVYFAGMISCDNIYSIAGVILDTNYTGEVISVAGALLAWNNGDILPSALGAVSNSGGVN